MLPEYLEYFRGFILRGTAGGRNFREYFTRMQFIGVQYRTYMLLRTCSVCVASAACTGSFVLLVLPVLAVFRPSVLLILPVLAVFRSSVLKIL